MQVWELVAGVGQKAINIWIKTITIESEENNFKLEMWYCFLCTIALLFCIFITIVKENVQF